MVEILEIIFVSFIYFREEKKIVVTTSSRSTGQANSSSNRVRTVSSAQNSNMKIPTWKSTDSSFADFVMHKIEPYFAIEGVSDNTKKVWSVLMALEAGSKYANHWRDLMTQLTKSGENAGFEDFSKFIEK